MLVLLIVDIVLLEEVLHRLVQLLVDIVAFVLTIHGSLIIDFLPELLLFSTFGLHLHVQSVSLIDFMGYFDEARFQLSELLNEEEFDTLQVFLLLGQLERELLELLVQELFLQLDLADQFVFQGDQLGIDLQVDNDARHFLFQFLLQLEFPREQMLLDLVYIFLTPHLLIVFYVSHCILVFSKDLLKHEDLLGVGLTLGCKLVELPAL